MKIYDDIRILFRLASTATFALEILDEGCRIVAKIAEINRLTALAEEQEPVEDLEQFTRRLMDTMQSKAREYKIEEERDNDTHVQRIACPLSARVRRNDVIAQAD